MSDAWPWDSRPMVILGQNQTGKTVLARQIHDQTHRVTVWLNASGQDRVESVPGKTVQSVRGQRNSLESALRAGHSRMELVTTDRETTIPKLKSWLFDKSDKSGRDAPLQVVLDESHEVAPNTQAKDEPSRDAVRRLASAGAKRNIKLVLLSQQPTRLDKTTVRESKIRVVYPMSAESQKDFSDYGFDFDQVLSNPDYCGVVHASTGEVIEKRVKASADYA